MEKCCQRIRVKSKRRKDKWGLESYGLVLRIGNRSSSNYYRAYQKTKEIAKTVSYETVNGLEFELEMKKQAIKSVKTRTNKTVS